MSRPTEPRKGQYVWHLGWEIGFHDDAEFWTDIGAPNLNAKTFAELIEEIEAEEEAL